MQKAVVTVAAESGQPYMPTYKQENRPVRINTPFGEDVLLVKSLAGTERLGRPFQYELVLASENHELDYKKIIGQNVTVFMDKGDKEPRYFNGFISRFAQTRYERKLAEYHATVVPWLWFLTRSSDCRIFQNMKIPDILKQVFQDFGFSDIIDRLHGSYRTWSYCVQYRETAYNFVSRLMEAEGIYYYFKHEDGKHSIVLCDSPASHKQFEGYEELLYRPSSSTTQETLNSWVVQHEVQSGAFAGNNFDFTAPKLNSLANSVQDRSHGQSQLEQFDYLGEQSPYDEYSAGAANENERYTKLRLEELQAQHETYSGDGDARGICNGVRFVLKGHPRKDFEKEYLTTGADYLIHCNTIETATESGADFKYHAKMTAMLLDDQFRTPQVTPKPIVHGPQTAIVVGPSGQKIYTDQYGQVKVQFHWDRLGKKDENSSCWIRVSQASAGKPQSKNWGDMAIPHIGDEVIVECLEGDPDRPIITGRVYNQANMPPMVLPSNQNKRTFCDDYGNELTFDATPDDEHILLRSPHHNSGITLGRSACTWSESNTLAATMGDVLTIGIGNVMNLQVGAYSMPVIGAQITPIVGGSYNINFASQCAVNYGPQFAVNGGIKYEKNEADFFKVCKDNVILSAGKTLNLVGGAGGAPGTAIMHANDAVLELTIGQTETVDPLTYKATVLVANIATAIIPIVSAVLVGAAGAFVGTYNKGSGVDQSGKQLTNDDGSNYVPTDDDKTQQTSSLQKQEDFMIAAGVVQACSLVSMIIAAAASSKNATETTAVSHPDDTAYTCRLHLDNQLKKASLEGKEIVELWSAAKKANITMDASAIKLEHQTGDIIIQTGTNTVKISSSGIEIGGASVKIAGTDLDFGGGAMTIMGSPAVTASTLSATVAKIKAADLAEKTKRQAEIAAAMLQRRALLMGNV